MSFVIHYNILLILISTRATCPWMYFGNITRMRHSTRSSFFSHPPLHAHHARLGAKQDTHSVEKHPNSCCCLPYSLSEFVKTSQPKRSCIMYTRKPQIVMYGVPLLLHPPSSSTVHWSTIWTTTRYDLGPLAMYTNSNNMRMILCAYVCVCGYMVLLLLEATP